MLSSYMIRLCSSRTSSYQARLDKLARKLQGVNSYMASVELLNDMEDYGAMEGMYGV